MLNHVPKTLLTIKKISYILVAQLCISYTSLRFKYHCPLLCILGRISCQKRYQPIKKYIKSY